MRKLFLLALVTLVAGIIPVAALAGLCASMPCCAEKESVVRLERPGCCSPANCSETAPQQMESARASGQFASVLPATSSYSTSAVTASQVLLSNRSNDLSPPPTSQQRLAILSILLI